MKITTWFSVLILALSLSFVALPKPVKAAAVPIPTLGSPGYTLSVCKFATYYPNGLVITKIRATFGKPAGTGARTATVHTYNTATTPVIYAQNSSTTWWGDTVTVIETPASYWWDAGVNHYTPDGFTSYMWTARYATAYTPAC